MSSRTDATGQFDDLSKAIARTIEEHFAKTETNINWPQNLERGILRVDTFLEDREEDEGEGEAPLKPLRVASCTIDLADIIGIKNLQNSAENESHDGHTSITSVDAEPKGPARNGTGRLRVANKQFIQEDTTEHQRQITSDTRNFPKRRKVTSEQFVFRPSTLDKLIVGIWEQLHSTLDLNPGIIFEQYHATTADNSRALVQRDDTAVEMRGIETGLQENAFNRMNTLCRKVTQASRVCRSIEIIVQAKWVEIFEDEVKTRILAMPQVPKTKHHKHALTQACQDFGWSEKELRNRMAIWRGYNEVKEAGGWVALVFAGMGIYRFCKYRVEFTTEAMKRLRNLRPGFEVAADTLHPNWRQLLSVVGESTRPQYPGHPHDWVVSEDGSVPVPLQLTYATQNSRFEFEQLEESVIDESKWRGEDPRWIPRSNAVAHLESKYTCAVCGQEQSEEAEKNSCYCFPSLFGCAKRKPPLVQVYRTTQGRNNGLLALAPFERGSAIGEFVGLITKDERHVDVMHSSTATTDYQIWQGRQGNFTRFINHSCKANAQYTEFIWLDTQHVVLVSKGIEAGQEIFVDYGDRYWAGLDKSCLCGESCCRYRRGSR